MLAEVAGKNVADGVEIGAAMMRHHALGIAGGAGGVTERDGVPFVLRRSGCEAGVARSEGCLVLDLADPAAALVAGIVDIDDERLRALDLGEGGRDHLGEFRIDQDHLGAAVIELERDGAGVEPDVQGVEHGAGHRHGEMDLVHRRNVRQHRRDGVAAADALLRQERGEAGAALAGFRPGETAVFVHRADEVRINCGGPFEEAERGQLHEVGRVFIEPDTVLAAGRHTHNNTSNLQLLILEFYTNT